MLSSIHPLGERARHNSWALTIGAYSLAAVTTALLVGATLGWAGSFLPLTDQARRWVLVGVTLSAAILDLVRVKPPGPARQVNERWIAQFRGWVYGAGFGAQLGIGTSTYVVTWGVPAVYVIELAMGDPLAAAIVGAVFGGGRALAPIAAGVIDRPSRLTAFHRFMARLGPPTRVATGVVFGMVALLGFVT